MDKTYKALRERIGKLDQPDRKFYNGQDGIHFQFNCYAPEYVEAIHNLLDALETRGAVRGDDYAICAFTNKDDDSVTLTIDTFDKWACTEDVICRYEETWL